MNEPFYTKYRPQSWEDVIGQDVVVESLQALLEKGHTHAFLITGPMGCGKTTIGRLIAKTLGCDMAWGFTEVNAGNDRGIETIRAINKTCQSPPLHGTAGVYLIDEAHRMTKDASEALLKTLEDCPSHAYFVLSTTEPKKILGTLKQRCTHYPIGYVKSHDLMRILNKIIVEEDLDITRPVLKRIVDLAEGSPRAALVLLEQLEVLEEEDKMMELLDLFTGNEARVLNFCQSLLKSNRKEALEALALLEEDAESIHRGVMAYMSVVVNKNEVKADRAADIMLDFMQYQVPTKPMLIWSTHMVCKGE